MPKNKAIDTSHSFRLAAGISYPQNGLRFSLTVALLSAPSITLAVLESYGVLLSYDQVKIAIVGAAGVAAVIELAVIAVNLRHVIHAQRIKVREDIGAGGESPPIGIFATPLAELRLFCSHQEALMHLRNAKKMNLIWVSRRFWRGCGFFVLLPFGLMVTGQFVSGYVPRSYENLVEVLFVVLAASVAVGVAVQTFRGIMTRHREALRGILDAITPPTSGRTGL